MTTYLEYLNAKKKKERLNRNYITLFIGLINI